MSTQAIYKYICPIYVDTMTRGNGKYSETKSYTVEKIFDESTACAKILNPRIMLKEIDKAVVNKYPLEQPKHESSQVVGQANKSIRPVEKIYIFHEINKIKE